MDEIIIIITLASLCQCIIIPVSIAIFPYRLHVQRKRQVLIPGSEVKEKNVNEMALRNRDAGNNSFSLNVSAIDFLYNGISISTIKSTHSLVK